MPMHKEAESLFWFFLVWSIVYLIVKKAIPYFFNKYVNDKNFKYELFEISYWRK